MKKLSKITESIWSDMQDRSAGEVVREEDKITTNEELKNRIQKLYKEQGEGETLDVSSLTNRIKCDDFSSIFKGYKKVKHIIGLENWDVSNVKSMNCMFMGCDNFNSDLSNWNVSSVEDMDGMFWGCTHFNSDLSKWNVRNVGDMDSMFWNCQTFTSDLSKWDVSNVEYMGNMFDGCKNFNSDLSNWNVSGVGDMRCMFDDCVSFNCDLSKWNVSNVKNMCEMFSGCLNFNSDLSNWDVSNVEDMEDMFKECDSLKNKPSWYMKLSKITESIWSDMQDRSTGDTVRKEDEIGNIKELKSVDMGGTVFWADKDLCCSDEYHFGYNEVFEYIKKSEWRLPTLKEVAELDEYKVKTYDNSFVISGPSEDLIFIARGLVYSDKVKEITDDDFYYAWTSDLYNNHQAHILTFDDNKLIHSKIDSNNIMDQITNDISGKLCVRLVKDK